MSNIITVSQVADMGGDNDDGSKWFVAGELRQAKRHHDANKKQGSAGQVEGAELEPATAVPRSTATGLATCSINARPRRAWA